MQILSIIKPSNAQYDISKNDEPIIDQFKKLTLRNQIITILATTIISLTTFCFAVAYFETLVGRFRKLQLESEKQFNHLNLNPSMDDIPLIDIPKNPSNDLIPLIDDQLLIGVDDGLNNGAVQKNNEIFFRLMDLDENHKLKIFITENDGSCGFHALIGTNENGIYQSKNILQDRKEFCDWLRSRQNAGQMPQTIKNIIQDYILDFENAPGFFRESVLHLRQAFMQDYSTLSFQEQDVRMAAFINDPVVIEAYLNNMQMQGTFLLQDELIVIGEFYNKRVILFQTPWGGENQYPDCNLPNFVPSENDVCIWFDGHHFERAEIV